MKEQGKAGLCWAFASTTAAEYSWAKEYFENTGKILNASETMELSPGHLGYFLYNRVVDPLGGTNGDENIIGEGLEAWPLLGGTQICVIQHLASYSGLGLEENTPYNLVREIQVALRGK